MKPRPPANGRRSRTGSLTALVVILLLVICAVWLIRILGADGSVQDCVLAGRLSCGAPPEP